MAEEEIESGFVESGNYLTLPFGAKRNENREIYRDNRSAIERK